MDVLTLFVSVVCYPIPRYQIPSGISTHGAITYKYLFLGPESRESNKVDYLCVYTEYHYATRS